MKSGMLTTQQQDTVLWKKKTQLLITHFFNQKALIFEPVHDKTNKIVHAPSKDSDQPGHTPSLIRVFAVHSIGS